jgi:hypothetical protein
MTEPYDGGRERPGTPEDSSTPDEEAEVSRLLAATFPRDADDAVPADVAARLDDVLAGLVAERAEHPASAAGDAAPVSELTERRRRRWPALLVAAAAVSVVGLGVGNVLGGSSGQMESAVTADSGGHADSEAVEPGDAAAPGTLSERQAPQDTADKVTASADVPRLRSDSLAVDVQQAADFALTAERSRVLTLRGSCVQPGVGEGDEWLAVRLDGERAVLVLRAADQGRRTAEVFVCDGDDVADASTSVEAD